MLTLLLLPCVFLPHALVTSAVVRPSWSDITHDVVDENADVVGMSSGKSKNPGIHQQDDVPVPQHGMNGGPVSGGPRAAGFKVPSRPPPASGHHQVPPTPPVNIIKSSPPGQWRSSGCRLQGPLQASADSALYHQASADVLGLVKLHLGRTSANTSSSPVVPPRPQEVVVPKKMKEHHGTTNKALPRNTLVPCPTRIFKKTKLCDFYHGKVIDHGKVMACLRGDGCAFAHGLLEMKSRPDLSKTKFCLSLFKTGRCAESEACPYAHSKKELRVVVETTPASKPTLHGAGDIRPRAMLAPTRTTAGRKDQHSQQFSQPEVAVNLSAPSRRGERPRPRERTDDMRRILEALITQTENGIFFFQWVEGGDRRTRFAGQFLFSLSSDLGRGHHFLPFLCVRCKIQRRKFQKISSAANKKDYNGKNAGNKNGGYAPTVLAAATTALPYWDVRVKNGFVDFPGTGKKDLRRVASAPALKSS